MLLPHWPVILFIVAGMAGSMALKKLTLAGALSGGLIGLLVYGGAGVTGLLMMALFFILSTAATAWHKKEKVAQGLSAVHDSRRTAAQVWANAGMAALLGTAAMLHPAKATLLQLMLAAVFSSATADTLASELGNVYGKRFYNIKTFKKDTKGLDGVVSAEGTLAGMWGSVMIALTFVAGYGWSLLSFIIIVMAGTIGNVADSVLGATIERKGWLGNNAVNFLNTVIAAIAALLLYTIFKS